MNPTPLEPSSARPSEELIRMVEALRKLDPTQWVESSQLRMSDEVHVLITFSSSTYKELEALAEGGSIGVQSPVY